MNSGNCRNSENIWDSLGISGNLWELGNLVKINKSVHREMYQKWKNENKIGDFRDFVSCSPVKVIQGVKGESGKHLRSKFGENHY